MSSMPAPLRILMYHRVLEPQAANCSPSVISATPRAFREQMRQVARRYRVLPIDEVAGAVREGRPLPPRALVITFDDGCRDFGEVAWPILREFRLPATVFVPTAYPGARQPAFWWDRLYAAFAATTRSEVASAWGRIDVATPKARALALRRVQRLVKAMPHAGAMRAVDTLCEALGETEAPRADVLGWDELRALAADGVTIAPHTRTHPALTRVSEEEARAEVRLSAEDVRREIGRCPRVFAYPFGDHDARVAELVRGEGFDLALTCLDGQSRVPSDDPFRLRRTGITPRTTPLVFRARLTAAGAWLDRWRHRGRRAGQVVTPAAAPVVGGGAAGRPLKVAYIMSRFPKLSETFVLNELVACAAEGVAVELFPLLRERQETAHPEVEAWVRQAHFHPFLSLPILRANARTFLEQPGAYLALLAQVLRETWRSPNFFVGALGIFPKSVRFAREMRTLGVMHVHAHFATHPALAAFIVRRLAGIPFSFTAHGSDLHVDRRMLDTKTAAAAFAVTVSKYNREVMVGTCGEAMRDKIHVIHCGVDPEVFTPGDGEPREGGRVQLVCVASFEAVKGHRFLVEACRLLGERGLAFDCHLVGEGPLRADIERRVVAAGLDRDVHFHGGRPRPEVASLLSRCDVAVLASHPTPQGKREGIPVALMEAMSAGLPVVATAISGIPELVQPGVTGFLVPSGDPGAIAGAVARLAGDPGLRLRMGRAGRARVMRSFDPRAGTLELVRLFQESAGHRAAGHAPAGAGRALAS